MNTKDLLTKLTGCNQLIEKILNENSKLSLLSPQNLNKLNNYFEHNKDYIARLEKNTIEIAIIGLEKAGKSTFANALLESNILPSSTERCTFTSTCIEYGEDNVSIQFYTEKEFNQKFKTLLEAVHCPSELYQDDFRQFDFQTFASYFNNLQNVPETENLYKTHIATTYLDIKDICEYKNDFNLTGERLVINSNIEAQLVDYIAGKEIENGIKNTALPRSVKEIRIQTTKLNQLQNGIIYDVPGFDSPIKEHQLQTKQQLDSADIIILITDATRPTLTSPSLKMLNNYDSKGLKLKDKLFIFGNRLDKANSLAEAQENISKLKESVTQNQLCDESRVFTGSALRYLKDQSIYQGEISASLEIETGINEIRHAIVEYNNHQRFEIIKSNAEINHKNILNLFTDILRHYPSQSVPTEKGIIRELENHILEALKCGINNARSIIREQVKDKKLTEAFRAQIDQMNDNLVTLDLIEKTYVELAKGANNAISISGLNNEIRKHKYPEIQKDFSILFEDLAKESTAQAKQDIIEAMANEFKDNLHYEDIKKIIETFVNKNAIESQDHSKFEYLFDRFSRHLFDIFIFPLNDNGRRNSFNQAKADFIYLDSHYSQGKNSGYSLIKLLLTQQDDDKAVRLISQLDSVIDEFISSELKMAQGAFSLFKKAQQAFSESNDKERFKRFCTYLLSDPKTLDLDVNDIISNVKECETNEDVMNEINTDILNIKDILKNAVITAMDLELVFFNSVDKNLQKLEKIITSPQSNENPLDNIMNAIQSSELEQLEKKKELYHKTQVLLQEIEKYLEN